MRVVCISDTHGHHRRLELPEGDVLVHAGDITHFGKERQVDDFNDWLGELSFQEKIVIAGNHECNNTYNLCNKITNGIYLDNDTANINGIRFFGATFFPTIFKGTVPAQTDVIISHNPPQYIGDGIEGKASGTGCAVLLEQVRKVQPQAHVFGHVHSGYGVYSFPNTPLAATTFVNAAICGGPYNYALTNQPIVIDIENIRE